jgi:small subunit ribosomal protein S17
MRGLRKTRTGVVISNKMDKTVVVAVVRMTRHSLYKKYIKRRVRYKAHDAENKCRVGDTVTIRECRPLSREKRWRVVEILQQAV